MPHRPPGASTSVTTTTVATTSSPFSSLPPTASAHIMRKKQDSNVTPVTPLTTAQPSCWRTQSSSQGANNDHLGTPKSSDSADKSSSDSSTVASLATESEEQHAAALLMVSCKSMGAARRGSIPLKKRKTSMPSSFVHTTDDTCHVSPVSDTSTVIRGGVTTAVSSEESSTPCSQDIALLESSKVHDANEIGRSSTAVAPSVCLVMPHFPTLLHQVLDNEAISQNVMEWCPDGEAWKVCRWDGLRRLILPRYFAELRDEQGLNQGTIDAFLHHLHAWGFTEVKTAGPSAGAYRHDLFIRGAQKLSSKMCFIAPTVPTSGPNTVSPGRVRLLQVPTLSASRPDGMSTTQIIPRSGGGALHFDGMEQQQTHHSMDNPTRRSPLNWPMMISNMGYRTEDPMYGGASSSPSEAAAVAAWSGYHRYAADPRAPPYTYRPPTYTPPGPTALRSGRGAIRMPQQQRTASPPTAPPKQAAAPMPVTNHRPSFPVSNRGRGKARTAAAPRPSATSPLFVVGSGTSTATSDKKESSLSSDATTTNKGQEQPVSLAEAQRIGGGVAVAVSRKTKRKLPLHCNNSSSEPSAVTKTATV